MRGLSAILTTDRSVALEIMKTTEVQSNPYMTRPSEVPAAGGCSVLVTTMKKIPMPTESAAAISTM